MCHCQSAKYLYCEQNAARAKFRSSGEKNGNLQSNECNRVTSTETNMLTATTNVTTPTIITTATHTTNNNPNDNNLNQLNNETLDLADLDLSKLRLTKKDIETLSSITPKLPKHYQDQLLAQLPPNQARKLSRTLSLQGHGPRAPCVFKRSLSSGRDALESSDAPPPPPPSSSSATSTHTATISIPTSKVSLKCNDDQSHAVDPSSLLLFDRNSVLRRSMSRSRDQSASMQRRSNSAIRSEFPGRLSYTGDLRSDYSLPKANDSQANRYRFTDYTSAGLRPEYYSKLPLPTTTATTSKNHTTSRSPTHEIIESPVHRRLSQRERESARFSRADLYGSASSINVTDDKHKHRQDRERETQNVLREIRERSHDRSHAALLNYGELSAAHKQCDNDHSQLHRDQRKSSIPNARVAVDKQNGNVELKSNGNQNDMRIEQSAAEFTDEILGELIRRSKEYSCESNQLPKPNDDGEKKAEITSLKKPKSKLKDGKKLKTKQKSVEMVDKLANNELKCDEQKPTTHDEIQSVTLPMPKSKIARRMSQPQKDDAINDDVKSHTELKSRAEVMVRDEQTAIKTKSTETNGKDAKLYPNSKLTPPKEVTLKVKKTSALNGTTPGNVIARNAITSVVEKFIEKSAGRLSPAKTIAMQKTKNEASADDGASSVPKPKTKKKIKVVKQFIQSDTQPTASCDTNESKESNTNSTETSPVKDTKSPEKKIKSGFLFAIGQKFEKMRENSKNKEKDKKMAKIGEPQPDDDGKMPSTKCVSDNEYKSETDTIQTIIIPRTVKDGQGETIQKEEITIRQIDAIPKGDQRRSRIDAVIRNLRERSVPHTIRAENRNSDLATESGLLKRAVSVEDMTNGAINYANKGNVNKVLGLFRRIEKEQQIQKQQQQQAHQSTYHCDVMNAKERPRSSGFVSKMKKGNRPYYTGAKSDTILTLTDHLERQYLNEKANQMLSTSKIPLLRSVSSAGSASQEHSINADCIASEKHRMNDVSNGVTKSCERTKNGISEKERIRNNRKGLVLDLTNEQYDDHFKKITSADCTNNNTTNSHNTQFNANETKLNGTSIQYNDSNENNNMSLNFTGNGNYYPYYGHSHTHSHSHAHLHSHGHSDRNCDALTPSYEMSTSNSSADNRILQDDCESTSTFLSPTEEPDLTAFDNWPACTGSTNTAQSLHHPKQLKYASIRNQTEPIHHTQIDPISIPSDSESMIDRIKRRSYYCRFNEKKPKRTSSIVGSAAQREYYREQSVKTKPKSSEYLFLVGSNGFHDSDGSLSRGGSKSPTLMHPPVPTGSSHRKENPPSRSTTPNCYSMLDDGEKSTPQPQYHYHVRQRSQTPSSVRSSFENSDASQIKSNEYLNLRSTLTSPPAPKYTTNASPTSLPIGDYRHSASRSSAIRSTAYDSLSPSIYATYNPKRRLSTSYLAPAIAAANRPTMYSSKDQLSTSCYATFGPRKPKAYDHRSLTMLDTSSISPTSLFSKRIGTSSSSSNSNEHTYPHHPHYRATHDYGHLNSRSSLRSPIHNSTSNV